eukprot:gene7826-1025_t
MKSSFVRKTRVAAADPGTRPGLHGQTLISMGLADLDKLLGGGVPLGSVVLVAEDPHSEQHLNLMRYFMAEGAVLGQKVQWLASRQPWGGVEHFLPPEAAPRGSSSASAASAPKAAGSNKPDSAADAGEPELRIAWQYRKYISESKQAEEEGQAGSSTRSSSRSGSTKSAVDAGIARQWCHTYDLTRHMSTETLQKSGLLCLDYSQEASSRSALVQVYKDAQAFVTSLPASSSGPVPVKGLQPGGKQQVSAGSGLQGCSSLCGVSPGFEFWSSSSGSQEACNRSALGQVYKDAQAFVASLPASSSGPVPVKGGPESVGRLVLQSLGGSAWSRSLLSGDGDAAAGGEQLLVQTLLRLKALVQDSRCCVMVTCPCSVLTPSTCARLQHIADAVLVLDTLSNDSDVYQLLPDAQSAVALLSVRKLPSAGMAAPRLADTTVYVLRNKRKRLAITPVEVDPDAEARLQDEMAAVNVSGEGAGGKGCKRLAITPVEVDPDPEAMLQEEMAAVNRLGCRRKWWQSMSVVKAQLEKEDRKGSLEF